MSKNSKQPIENAGKVIEAFGGIRPMAAKIDTPVTTVQGWKKRDVIPGTRRDQIMQAANDHKIDLSKLVSKVVSETSTVVAATSKSVKKKQVKNKRPVNASKSKTVPSSDASTPSAHSETLKAKRSSKPEPTKEEHERLMAAIEDQGRKNVVTSTWIAVILILLTAALGAFLLWPKAQETVETQNEKIAALEEEVSSVSDRPGFFETIIPQDIQVDLQERADQLQNQVKNVQNTVEQLSQKAEAISSGVLDPNAGPLSQRLEVLEEQVREIKGGENFAALIDRIQNLEESFTGQEQLNASMEELKSMMITREQIGGTINDGLASAQEKSGALGETLEGVSGTDLKAAAMLIAFTQMRNAFYRQEPFENDLAVLQRLAGEENAELQEAIAKLAPHANGGVLSSEGLSREFKGLAGDIVVSSLQGEDVSLKEKAQARLHSLLQVEKEGASVTGTQTQAAVARAQKMLDEGNIEGAVAELQGLDGAAAVTAQPFIEQAKASLIAGNLEQLLGDSILSKLSDQLPLEGLVNGSGFGNIQKSIKQMMPHNISGNSEGNIQENIQGNIPDIGKVLEDVPLVPNNVITDEKSGVTILPKQQGFKGFSSGKSFE